jgi:hypothetical protein
LKSDDVHSELYDVRTCKKENKGFNKKTKPGYTSLNALLKMTLLFSKHESAVEFSQVRKYFFLSRLLQVETVRAAMHRQ